MDRPRAGGPQLLGVQLLAHKVHLTEAEEVLREEAEAQLQWFGGNESLAFMVLHCLRGTAWELAWIPHLFVILDKNCVAVCRDRAAHEGGAALRVKVKVKCSGALRTPAYR